MLHQNAIRPSAGGLSALRSFVEAFPVSIKFPIVFIQHLSPEYKSLLPELLKDIRPDLNFREIQDGETINENTFYLSRPGKLISIKEGHFELSDPKGNPPHYPINHFFSNIAHEYSNNAIVIPSEQLSAFYELMHQKTGLLFNHFRKSVIGRRVVHRAALNGFTAVDDYLKYLSENNKKARQLSNDFMIGVTSFFRDYSEWENLRNKIIAPLLETISNEPLRIWMPACATGEEVYSIAIIIQLEMEKKGLQREIQIFATDINQQALIKARDGRYKASATLNIPPAFLKSFFDYSEDGQYVVVKEELREKVVFAKQDILHDPPFSKLDLIICRNLLIYFTTEAQEKCFEFFQYALKENGYLFLGASETVGKRRDLFIQIEPKSHIFERVTISKPARLSVEPPITAETLAQEPSRPTVREQTADFYCNIQETSVPKSKTLFLIAFEEKEYTPPPSTQNVEIISISDESALIRQLENELTATRHDLQKHIEQLKA